MQEVVATGSTVDEAVDNACAQLGLTRDDVTYEIIDMPQKKLFGTSPAKVKVTPLDVGFSVKELFTQQTPQQEEKPEKQSQRTEPREKKQSRNVRQPAAQQAQPQSAAPAAEQPQPQQPEIEMSLETLPAPAQAALAYFKEIAAHMGAEKLEYKAVAIEKGVKFVIDGEDGAIMIGRRGETMDALQYLCMLVSSRTEGDYCKIMLDVANYRSKREKTLQSLAAREAAKVKKTLYNQVLEPMNPYERRIVHSAIQGIEGVKSESVGNEPHRRVVISMISGGKGSRSRKGGPDRGGHGGNKDRGRGGNFNRNRRDFKGGGNNYNKQQNQPATENQVPKSDIDPSKLYGKIDL